jgi:hypothetical protein
MKGGENEWAGERIMEGGDAASMRYGNTQDTGQDRLRPYRVVRCIRETNTRIALIG